ncbi:SDR family NAD(P)-dependent oxidoreductase [Natrarchaeobius oligotrophus]|uniref:SDR family oxidoreductase n=1 Tax=Natrarchaeobius chitinivorans TaxID=1679083 RepID=A0A3N6PLJ5_NATCH|nr:SDR family oxidoreductase [Natrarchaeobius chitinivorans]RQH02320.1 SDR family oxidoreductase [Natrarchaeobius chitinivorans]
MASTADRTAVVTGGSSGIGREISKRLAADGAHVVVVDVADGSATVDAITDAGGSAEYRSGDVTDAASMEAAMDGLEIATLVNNAAYYAPLVDDKKRFDEIDEDEWNDVLAVNVTGTFLASKAALPRLEPGSSVVNISSATVHTGVPGFLHYVASKAAIVGMTRAMATELGAVPVRVNAITPGFTWSEASQQAGDEYLEQLRARQTIEETIEPEHIADAVAFLASDDSERVTGQVLNVDGGVTYY